jgi:ABC-type polysaccharide/polyol phosphate export permease
VSEERDDTARGSGAASEAVERYRGEEGADSLPALAPLPGRWGLPDHRYLSLLREMIVTQIKLKDQSPIFGLLWSLLHPLILLSLLYLVFRARLGANIDNYPLFLLIGLVQYAYFSNATAASMAVLHSMKSLTTEALFPKEILVMATVGSRTLEFLLGMLFCVALAAIAGIGLSLQILWLVPVIVLEVVLCLWVSIMLSWVYLFFRDLRHLYQVFLRMLFFITPIFYDVDFIGGGLARRLIELNPLTQLILFTRSVLLEGRAPSVSTWSTLFVLQLVCLAISLWAFRRLEPRFAEQV